MHRGARREVIFRGDEHCLLFLRSVGEAVERYGLEVHAYSLMPNHYHLLVRSPLANLSRCMKHVNATYTQRLNLRHGWDGPLFRGRFRSQIVEDDAYLDHLFAYVHLNPFRAGLATRLDEPCWTSLRAYLGKERAPAWLRTEFFSARLGGRTGVEDAIRSRRKRLDEWPEELDRDTGWIWPSNAGSSKTSVESPVDSARVSVSHVLKRVALQAGCSVASLKQPKMGRGANPARRVAVWALSRAPGYSHREIANALDMSEGQVAKVLWRMRQELPTPPLSIWMEAVSEWQKVESGRA